MPKDRKLRRVKYLNNIIEQDHRAIRRRWRAMQCFRCFHTAERAIEGIEAMHLDEKGSSEEVGRERRGRAGEARRNPLRCGGIGEEIITTFLASNQYLQRYP